MNRRVWLEIAGMRVGGSSPALSVPHFGDNEAHSDGGGDVGIKALFICCDWSQRGRCIRSQDSG